MGKNIWRMLLIGSACIGSLTASVAAPYAARAAVAVIDQANLAVNKITADNTTQSLIRLISQLELDIKNIASMNSGSLFEHLTALNGEFNRLRDMVTAFEGGMNPDKAQPFSEKGMKVDELLSGAFDIGERWNLLGGRYKELEKSYSDTIRLAKEIQAVNAEYSKLEKILKTSADAEGQKEAQQADTQMNSLTASAIMEGNLLMAQQNALLAEKYQQENLEKAAAKAATDASIKKVSETVTKAIVKQPKTNREVMCSMYPKWLADEYE
jgi:conjugal transfer/entry exclusion protein